MKCDQNHWSNYVWWSKENNLSVSFDLIIYSPVLIIRGQANRNYNRWLLALVLVLLITTTVFAALYAVNAKKSTATITASTTTAAAAGTTTAPFGKEPVPRCIRREEVTDGYLISIQMITSVRHRTVLKQVDRSGLVLICCLSMNPSSQLSLGINRCDGESVWRFLSFCLWLMDKKSAYSWRL